MTCMMHVGEYGYGCDMHDACRRVWIWMDMDVTCMMHVGSMA